MNKIKKLGIVLVALAMCMMLGVTGWAANSVSYSVEPKQATVCVSEGMQMVTVTLKASEDIQITSMYLEVIMPTNWSINTIRNDTLGITEDNYHTKKDPVAEKHCVVWIEPESGNKTIKAGETLLAIDYDVPANAKGIFTLGVENLELATMKDGYNLEVLTQETTVTTTVTIKDHEYTATGYTWNADNTECTAAGKCACGKTTTKSASVTSNVTKKPTCVDKGETTYTATFNVDWAKTQTKVVEDVAKLEHSYTGEIKNDGDTHSFKCVNGCEQYGATADHNFESGDCVCGAEEPVAILYGDANGDDSVDARDLSLLQQYIAGWDVTLDAEAADANGDGSVDARDLSLLQQHIAGWDVTLGPVA